MCDLELFSKIRSQFIFKKIFILWTSAAQFLNSFMYILDIIFTDSVKLKE